MSNGVKLLMIIQLLKLQVLVYLLMLQNLWKIFIYRFSDALYNK